MLDKLKNVFKHFSPGPKAALVIVIIVAIVTMSTLHFRKNVTIVIDGRETKITTFRSNLKSTLENNGIEVGPKDRVTPGLDSTVENGTKVYIKKAVNIQVLVDGKKLNIASSEDSVGNMLKAEGIKLSSMDIVYPSKEQLLDDGLQVQVSRVEAKLVKQVRSIEFATVIKNSDNMGKGQKKLVQDGKDGEKLTSFRVIYKDGKEVSRQVVKESVLRKPVQKIVAIGTLGVITPSRGGSQAFYTKYYNMRATAYTSDYASTGKSSGDPDFNITKSGTRVRRNLNGYSTIAVDPRVIPLGTRVYVEGYGYAIAEDTGGAIKGNRIDVFFNSGSEVDNWGVKYVKVYMLK